jgi:hypothetical protein
VTRQVELPGAGFLPSQFFLKKILKFQGFCFFYIQNLDQLATTRVDLLNL